MNTNRHKKSIAVLLGSVLIAGSVMTVDGNVVTADAVSKSKSTYEQTGVPQVISRMSPSVVGIIGKVTPGSMNDVDDRYNLAHGTGVIWKSDGWIITNAHVVDGLSGITVVTSDGKSYKARAVHSDPKSDIALVKINAKSLKPAKFAASAQEAIVGETVVAIGTPISFSLRNSASVGVVSGLNRSVDGSYRLIQTDTAINPGNSGGPLVNLKGEVIGINSKKFAAVGIENMGFSIPAETVSYVANHLLKYGEVRRASLGLELEESWSAIVGLPSDDPLTVTKVRSGEARKAGIEDQDVLYAINGKRVYSVVDINERLKSFMPGQQVRLLMQRDGDIIEVTLKLSQDGAMAVEGGEGEFVNVKRK
ncbi:S1C family serine protease [Paenibacillus sp. JCM 10914]|uniref:S1C family serine protease n=1 Tax=Paenibacillus sp. JCM 10914 TaxID=1236974 RepID=UPI00068FC57A|nr:trypsin-like peptidase domain-containing protein [Paenibacillus sp. JCM 10914]